MSRRVLAFTVVCLLPTIALPAQNSPAGVVLQTQSARLNQTDASVGTTLYDGDRLETSSGGALNVRSNQALLTLPEGSLLWMNHEGALLTPSLDRGTVIFRAEAGQGIEIHADFVRVRPHAAVRTVGQVTIDDSGVTVTARTQSLDVQAENETRVLEGGKTLSFRRRSARVAARYPPLEPVRPQRPYVGAGIIGGTVMFLGVREALESPDRP